MRRTAASLSLHSRPLHCKMDHMRLRNIPEAKGIVEASPYVIHHPEAMRGKWASFSGKPLFLEVGTGKGRFIMELAARHPENEYIGIERYESVLYRACEKMAGKKPQDPASLKEAELQAEDTPFVAPANLHFIRMDAAALPEVFAPGEVAGLYLNFSDPWPKARHAKRRLTSRTFLAVYEKVLTDGGILEFKTDNRALFDFSLEELAESPDWFLLAKTTDLHKDIVMNAENIMTEYERKFSALGNKICKLIAVYEANA